MRQSIMTQGTTMTSVLLGGLLLGTPALLAGCAPTPTSTTTTDQTTTRQSSPVSPPMTSITTTKTQNYTP